MKTIEIPPEFILPEFQSPTSKDIDIFSFGSRSIKGMWINYIKIYLRDILPRPDM